MSGQRPDDLARPSAPGELPITTLPSELDSTPGSLPSEAVSTRKALVFVYAGYLLRYLYLLVLIPFYGRVLGAGEYGRLLAAMSLYQVVWLLCEYGFPIAGARDVAATTDRSRLASLYGQHIAGRLWMAVPGIAIGLGGTLLSPLFNDEPLLGILATLNGLAAALNLGWYFQGIQRFRTSVALEVVGFAINLPVILWFVSGPGDAWIILATLLASSLICVTAAHVIAKPTMDRKGVRLRGGWQLVRGSTALFAHKGVTMMMASSSTYLLSLFASASQVGWYGAAERLAAVGLSLMQPANHVLVGTVSKRISTKSSEASAYRLMRSSFLVMTGFGVALLLGTLLLAKPLVPLILGPAFGPTVGMLNVLALMFPFVAFAQVVSGYVLIPLRRDRLMSAISLFGALVTVALILILAHYREGFGVAVARTCGTVALAAALLFVLHRERLLNRIWHA
ncbi:lipopolysaccharide biosynthesis protein [Methylibium sp.]|uniref:lipopolysaccharide biosynthesis protein n=1 Tax=Methylibium sp. TaxID=2067992 RepID=UPI003D0B849A